MCAKYGKETVKDAIARFLKNSADFSRRCVEAIPDGVYTASSIMDKDVLGNGPFPVQVAVTIKGDSMTVDFTGSAKQTPGPINLTHAGLISAMRSIFLACTDPEQDINDGVFEPLTIIAEEGSIFNARARRRSRAITNPCSSRSTWCGRRWRRSCPRAS